MARRRAEVLGFYTDEEKRVRPITKSSAPRIVKVRFKSQPYPYSRPRRIKAMLAKNGTLEDLDRPDLWLERKYDGTWTFIIKDGDRVRLIGRSWKNDYAPNFPELVEAVRRIRAKRFVACAELTYFDKHGDDHFLTALATPETRRERGLTPKLMVFDLIYYGNRDLRRLPLRERRRLLEKLIKRPMKHLELVKVYRSNKRRVFRDLLRKGAEGVMLKDPESPFREGVRSSEWLKLKREKTADVVVVGVTRGKGQRRSTFGALILAKRDRRGRLRYVGKASGFSEAELRELLRRFRKVKRPPIDEPVSDVKYWVKPEIVVEVKYMEETKDGKLRHPRFTRIKDDKTLKEL